MMTNEEALHNLRFCKCEISNSEFIAHLKHDTVRLAIKALDKQIPKKPKDHYYTRAIYDNEGYEVDALFIYKANCPCCNDLISEGELEKSDLQDIKYCQSCGQKLDWSDEDGE